MTGGPIYVAGLDRVGKTTMAAYLSSHPRISIPAVGSNMWTYFYDRFGDLAEPANLDRCLEAMLRYKHVRFLDPDPIRIRREFLDGSPTYGRLFSLLLIHHAERRGKPRWGAQTGLVERYADQLFVEYPGLKVVHMVRDPRDRYQASRIKWPDGRGQVGAQAARWHYSVALAERNSRRYGDSYLVVRFEDLVRDSEGTLRHVCAFLDEEYDESMLSMAAAPKLRAELVGERVGVSAGNLLSDEFIGSYQGWIGNNDLRFLQRYLGPLMVPMGYDLEPLNQSLTERLLFAVRFWPGQYARAKAWRGRERLHMISPQRFGHRYGARMYVAPETEGETVGPV